MAVRASRHACIAAQSTWATARRLASRRGQTTQLVHKTNPTVPSTSSSLRFKTAIKREIDEFCRASCREKPHQSGVASGRSARGFCLLAPFAPHLRRSFGKGRGRSPALKTLAIRAVSFLHAAALPRRDQSRSRGCRSTRRFAVGGNPTQKKRDAARAVEEEACGGSLATNLANPSRAASRQEFATARQNRQPRGGVRRGGLLPVGERTRAKSPSPRGSADDSSAFSYRAATTSHRSERIDEAPARFWSCGISPLVADADHRRPRSRAAAPVAIGAHRRALRAGKGYPRVGVEVCAWMK